MNVEYINPFIEATKTVIKDTTGYDSNVGKVFLRDSSSFSTSEVVVVIGLTGDMVGQVFISMDRKNVLNISSAMVKAISGQEFTEIDPMCISAVSELSNMILGNATTMLFKRGLLINISPPSIISGKNLFISNKLKTLCIPINITNESTIEINVSTEEISKA